MSSYLKGDKDFHLHRITKLAQENPILKEEIRLLKLRVTHLEKKIWNKE
jgi:hypothetical protein